MHAKISKKELNSVEMNYKFNLEKSKIFNVCLNLVFWKASIIFFLKKLLEKEIKFKFVSS